MIPVIGAFASGNQVVLKPSEFAPAAANLLKSLIEEWRPSGDVNVQQGGRDVSESLCRQGWGMIFFTGGTETGKRIMAAASQTLTPVTLELGGKSPCFIDESVPLEKSLRRILWGKSFNAGQTCVAPDYLLVPRALQGDVIRISSAILSAFFAPSALESTHYGKIIHRNHFDRLRSLMNGGQIAYGGKTDSDSLKIEPTLLSDVDLNSPLMREEIFGPLLPIVPYDSIDGALEIIRERENPLAFYIFSQDCRVRERLLNEVNCGGVCINDTLVHLTNPELPFGGIRSSGIGAYHGPKSFEIFSHFKSVEKKSLAADLWLRYPPYKIKLNRFLKKFV
jgi:aldehyde dehydrogenase (NAD+)